MGRPHNAVGAGVFGDAASSGRWRRVVGTHEGVERALEAAEERHGSSAAAAGTAAVRGSLKSDVVVLRFRADRRILKRTSRDFRGWVVSAAFPDPQTADLRKGKFRGKGGFGGVFAPLL